MIAIGLPYEISACCTVGMEQSCTMDVTATLPCRHRILFLENGTLEPPLEPIFWTYSYNLGDSGAELGSDQEQGYEYLTQPTGLYGGEDD